MVNRPRTFEWNFKSKEEIRQKIREGEIKLPSQYTSFNDREEFFEFILGNGRYQEANSFGYSQEEEHIQQAEENSEWFICPKCLEDFKKHLDGEIPLEQIKDEASYQFRTQEYTETRPRNTIEDKEEKIRELQVYCPRHSLDPDPGNGEFFKYKKARQENKNK